MRLRETLDTPMDFRQWMYGNGLEAKYSFALAKTPMGLRPAPPDIPLGDKTPDEKRREIEREFGTPAKQLHALQFEVEFNPVDPKEQIHTMGISLDTQRIVEMHFARRECILEYQPIGRRFYWRSLGESSDRDEGDLQAKDALKVFAGVTSVALKYHGEHAPDGILLGTRHDAKESRGRIYRRIAERLATEKGAQIITPEDWGRNGMKSQTLVWFPRILR